jgi:F-type H+-transporting ATPase subunit epsilon
METPFNVRIYTPERTIFDDEAVSLCAPGECGYFGVLAHHAPFISALVPGTISLKDKAGENIVFHSKGKGFFEVVDNKAVFLLDAVDK